MKLRIIDYQFPRGGVERFIEGILCNLPEDEIEVSVFSADYALEGYRDLAKRINRPLTIVDRPTYVHRTAVALKDQTAFSWMQVFETPPAFWEDTDLVWFPSIQRHVVRRQSMARTVATFHDAIPVELGEFMAERRDLVGRTGQLYLMALDDLMTRRLMGSMAKVVVSSQRTLNYLSRTYGPLARAPEVVHVASDHITDVAAEPVDDLALPSRFLIYAAAMSPHKNHEPLLAALAKVKTEHPEAFLPLVLTGANTAQLVDGSDHRSVSVRTFLERLNLRLGTDVYALGTLSNGRYRSILERATAMVVPTLAEGGGTFSAAEAASLGVPLASSNIEVMLEYLGRLGVPALWFQPHSVDEIAAALVQLCTNETELRARAAVMKGRLTDTTWEEVGHKYLAAFREQAQFAAMHDRYGV